MKKSDLFLFDLNYRKSYPQILGIDEVGRGCCAGPLVVVGIILKDDFYLDEIQDSKKIKSIKKREELKTLILQNCITCRIKVYSPQEVDLLNPKQASRKGMQLIANTLNNRCDVVFTDFEKINSSKNINITKGDSKSFTIACASIVAKSFRDKIIERISKKYPNYDFINHQGYCTKKHLEALKEYGPIKSVHRYSYKTISNLNK